MTALRAFLPPVNHLYIFTQTLLIQIIPPTGNVMIFAKWRIAYYFHLFVSVESSVRSDQIHRQGCNETKPSVTPAIVNRLS